MIRLILKVVNYCPEGAVTGKGYRTFDVELPEVESALKTNGGYYDVSIVGGEILTTEAIDED